MTKIAILGYGNLGKGVENAIKLNDDLELVAIFTRRMWGRREMSKRGFTSSSDGNNQLFKWY